MTIIHRTVKRPYYGTIWKWKSPKVLLEKTARLQNPSRVAGNGSASVTIKKINTAALLKNYHLIK